MSDTIISEEVVIDWDRVNDLLAKRGAPTGGWKGGILLIDKQDDSNGGIASSKEGGKWCEKDWRCKVNVAKEYGDCKTCARQDRRCCVGCQPTMRTDGTFSRTLWTPKPELKITFMTQINTKQIPVVVKSREESLG